MNRSVLLNSINLLIDHNSFDPNRINAMVNKQFGLSHYNQLPLDQMQLLHNFLVQTAKQTNAHSRE